MISIIALLALIVIIAMVVTVLKATYFIWKIVSVIVSVIVLAGFIILLM